MTTYVLVPGAGGSAWYWHAVERELQARGHVVVAVELPGQDDSKHLADYADAVVQAATGLGDVVVVAQSMGALTAPLVVGRLPVQALVLLNAMVPLPGETGGQWWSDTDQPEAQLDGDPFLHDLPDHVIEELPAHAKEQSVTPFSEPWPLAAWPDVPTGALAGVDDRLFPLEFQQRILRERLGLEAVPVAGGHLAGLSRPVEVSDALEALVAELVLR
jgi:pimeloyl-ACP methyl ester carboxylesterase